jgi:superfamily II DNA or RNA helicase
MKIYVNNPVWSAVDPQYRDLLGPPVSHPAFWYKYDKTSGRMKRMDYTKNMIDVKGNFLTGLIPRLKWYMDRKGIKYEIINKIKYDDSPVATPFIKGIKFRPDQKRAINAALENRRGIIVAPTGSGKTVVLGGLVSCYPKGRTLFLCHGKDLLQQTYDEFGKFGFKDLGLIDAKHRDLNGKVVVAIRQSFIKLDPEDYMDYFDRVFIDECHHSKEDDSQIVEILSNMTAEERIGVSATFPSSKAARLTLEGCIGPVIDELTVQEGIELGIISTPDIRIRKTEYHYHLHDLDRYTDVYQEGIVDNYSRNRQIMKDVKAEVQQGNSTLTFVTKIEHGENLLQAAEDIGLEDVHFIHGSTEDDERTWIKKNLMKKKIKAVIATTVWDEGINIPSLNCVLNAAGGKSEIKTLQRIGRGLRTDEETRKTRLTYYDYFDPSHYFLIEHFGQRCTLYCEMGWIR